MREPHELVQHCRRRWWWSQAPFYDYHVNGVGWGNLVDTHPGMFNLAWVLAGGPTPRAVYTPYAATTLWVLEQSPGVIYKKQSLPDAALAMTLPQFWSWLSPQPHRNRGPYVATLRLQAMALACLRTGNA